jgi:hypothetical protein
MTDLTRTRHSLLVRLRDPADAAAWRTFLHVHAPAASQRQDSHASASEIDGDQGPRLQVGLVAR